MAKQIINIGASSNDKSGDTLRSGAIKINSNFTELYNNNQSVFDRLTAGQHITLTKTGNNCTITANVPPYVLQPANTANLGGVKVDGSTILINGYGVIRAVFPTDTNITGNAGTVTNGVYTTGSYANPPWITELAFSKISNKPTTYYTLPAATTTEIGGVKVDGVTVTIDENDVIHASHDITGNAGTVTNGVYTTGAYLDPPWIQGLSFSKIVFNLGETAYTLPIATTSVLGGVKVDGTSITINNGVISGANTYTLPIATTSVLGGVKVDGTSITINNGVISSTGSSSYTLPIATTSVLGGVKVDGTSITINNGVISGANTYTLPIATTSVLGGVKVDGSTVTINNGVISASTGGSGLASRTNVQATTGSIAAGATANLTITGFKSYALLQVTTNSTAGGAWVRIYTDSASRTADAARVQTDDPTTSGVIAEVITTSNSTVVIAPGVVGFNNESTPTSNIELAVTNTTASAGTFTITLTVVRLEN